MSTDTAVLLNISEMIDLAIGTPEVGVVDFNMLQTVLHCLAQQQRVLDKNVELRGSAATLPITRDIAQTIAVSEYLVDTESPPKTPAKPDVKEGGAVTPKDVKKGERLSPGISSDKETMLVVERVKKPESTVERSPLQGIQTGTEAPKTPSPITAKSPPPVPAGMPTTEKLSLVTTSKFNILENIVDDLKNRVYGSMPKNEDILEEVRSQSNLKAITDMWTSFNVTSRLEAAEAGLGKLSSLVQDLIANSGDMQNLSRVSEAPFPAFPSHPAPPGSAPPAAPAISTLGTGSATKADLAALQSLVEGLRGELEQLNEAFYATMDEINVVPAKSEYKAISTAEQQQTEVAHEGEETLTTIPSATGLSVDATSVGGTAPGPPSIGPSIGEQSARRDKSDRQSVAFNASQVARINELEKRITECCESINKNTGVMQDQIHSFQDQIEYLQKQVATLTADLSAGKLSPDLIKDLQGLMQLFSTVQDMQEQLKQVHDTALHLAAEKENRQQNMDEIIEQIELLKNIKLDREDMVEAMAEKADLRMLARKVSHDQFELACDDLSRGLEHALGKLNVQEALWQQALDDIQREIETKLDKMELSPVKEFFNNKLKQLQEHLKQMASLRKEVEAAGTKRRLLRDVNCISCDAKAVMPTEAPSTIPVAKPLAANFSMKPYLSYELDAIRKSQATNVQNRNMNDWETIDKQMAPPKQKKVRSETDKHLCNRYCGGSHTVTTPAQRVARLGHFIKQWGPDVLPLSSGLATGDDGRMYKVSVVENANVGPGGAVDAPPCTSPPPKKDPPKPKPIIMTPECRCLDGDGPGK